MVTVIGRRIAHYEILDELGSGGMGVVYRARDTRLRREVAIKALPREVAGDDERLARFEREARVLASLNHRRIGAIYGLERVQETPFLVLELIEGETLAERLRRGPLPVSRALELAIQIAEGLEAAHEAGVIHRDLKPGNLKLTRQGTIKILDFGLSKALAPIGAGASQSPTLEGDITRGPAFLGTVAYMSPEQTRAQEIDKRSDIWAFGCVLFEMLSGRKAFGAETASDAISRILEHRPSWDALPPRLPRAVVTVLRRCLEKDPQNRLRDIGDARLELREALEEPDEVETEPARSTGIGALAAVGALALIGFGLAIWAWNRTSPSPPPAPVTRWVHQLPSEQELVVEGRSQPIALSPDGTRLVYAADSGTVSRLYLRDLGALEARPLAGTEEARTPFFSPDGQWVAFFSGSRLMKLALGAGAPVKICDVPLDSVGADWGGDGTIVFASYASGLWRVSADSGEPEQLTTLDPDSAETSHRWPHFSPDGRYLLFTIGTQEGARLAVLELENGTRVLVDGIAGLSRAMVLSTGELIFAQAGGLAAVPFDWARAEIRGTPVQVLTRVASVPYWGVSYFAVSDTGTLAYLPGSAAADSSLVWVDRDGVATPASAQRAPYLNPKLSPDGKRAVVTIGTETGSRQLWMFDLERDTRDPLTTRGNNEHAVWHPDGERLVFSSNRSGTWHLYTVSVDGGDEPKLLLADENELWATSWSNDGKLAFYEIDPVSARDIYVLTEEDPATTVPFVVTPFNEKGPAFSPDGRWLAYVSSESGRDEIYVRGYPAPGPQARISTSGGSEPAWSPDGSELFYRDGAAMMAVEMVTEPSLAPARPRRLFEKRLAMNVVGNANYSVARDGMRFLMVQRGEQSVPRSVTLVLNWLAEVEQRMSTS